MRPSLPVRIPIAPLPLAVALFWLCLNLVAFYEPSRRWPVLYHLYQPVIFLLRSSRYVRSTVGALWLAHLLEGAYAASLCGQAGLPAAQVAGWAGVTFVMGFGVLPGLSAGLRRAEERHLRDRRRALAAAGAAARAGNGHAG